MLVSTAPPPNYDLNSIKRAGLLVILFGFVATLAWAAYVPLDSAIVSSGVVKVDTENKKVQHLEGGIVEEILVRDGQFVRRGQALIKLDKTFALSEQKRLAGQLTELLIRQSLLLSQRNNLPTLTIDASQFDLIKNPEIEAQISSAEQLFALSYEVLQSELAILDAQMKQLEEQVESSELEKSAKQKELALMQEESASWKTLVDRKLADKLRYLEVQRQASELEGEVAQLHASLSGVKAKLSEVELERFRVVQAYQEKAAASLAEVELQLGDITERLEAAESVLKRVEIAAPVSGLIVGMQVHTIGAVIRTGETILEIVPKQDELIVESRVKPIDVDKVQQGLKARVKLSSYKIHELPDFDGSVDSVSADAFSDPNTGETYYKARIIIPAQSLAQLHQKKIQSGMPAEVFIQTGESTPLQYLMDPLVTAFNRAWRES